MVDFLFGYACMCLRQREAKLHKEHKKSKGYYFFSNVILNLTSFG